MPPEARGGGPEPSRRGAHPALREQPLERPDRGLDRRTLLRVEGLKPRGEPRRPPRPHQVEHPRRLVGHGQADAPTVGAGRPFDEPRPLEPGDVRRDRRGRDALAVGERTDTDARLPLDREEQRRLARRDPERVELAAQLPREPQQHRTERVRHSGRVGVRLDTHE